MQRLPRIRIVLPHRGATTGPPPRRPTYTARPAPPHRGMPRPNPRSSAPALSPSPESNTNGSRPRPSISRANVRIASSASRRSKSWVCIASRGHLPRLDQADRAPIARRRHADRAPDRDLLHHDLVRDEVPGSHGIPSQPASTTCPPHSRVVRGIRRRASSRRRTRRRRCRPRRRPSARGSAPSRPRLSASIVTSAPNCRASASFSASAASPVTMIFDAPASRQAITLARPR